MNSVLRHAREPRALRCKSEIIMSKHTWVLQNIESYLAGGLDAQNVAQAISSVDPYGVDVSSGVESSRGVKDESLIHAFCQAVRQADAKA